MPKTTGPERIEKLVNTLRQWQKIEREAELHCEESPGLIQIKMNALEDAGATRALYRASQAGVKVDLIIRDTCRLRPGIPGLSDTVNVISIVGRFLEHSRIVYFRNGGDEEYYIGSADLMPRNLNRRVEALVPVDDPRLKARLEQVIEVELSDSGSPAQPSRLCRRELSCPDPSRVEPGGLGVQLIHRVFDECEFCPGESSGNRVIMRLRKPH